MQLQYVSLIKFTENFPSSNIKLEIVFQKSCGQQKLTTFAQLHFE